LHGLFPSAAEWRTGVRYAIVAATLAFVIWKAQAIFLGLLPFLVAFGISLAIEPLVRGLSVRLRLGRAWSAFIVLLGLLFGTWWLIAWAATALIDATAHFLDVFPQYRDTVVQFVQETVARLNRAFATLPPDVTRWVNENTSRLGEAVEQLLSTLGRGLLVLLRTVPGLLTTGLLIPLATFFISKDLPAIKELLWSLVPAKDRPRVVQLLGDLWAAVWNYLRAATVLVTITTVIATVGLAVVGIDNWFAAGLFIGLLDFLPVVGPTLAFAPWILYLVIVGNTSLALSLLVVYALSSGTRSLVEAKVIGSSIGLPPLAILLSMYVGALVLGVIGAIVGPILVFVATAAFRAWKRVDPPRT